MKTEKQIRGKKARTSGSEFERRVGKDLEEKGWIVDKWGNNVELYGDMESADNMWGCKHILKGKLIPAKPSRFRLSSTGFCDFVCFRFIGKGASVGFIDSNDAVYEIIGVEVKTNGYLTKEEREKCQWYLDNQIFSKILIARKEKVKNRINIIYEDFNYKYGKKCK